MLTNLFGVKRHFSRLNADDTQKSEFAVLAGSLRDQIGSLERRLNHLEQRGDSHSEWLSQAESLHLNRRGQILRLHRRGDSAPEIASALRVAQGEVKLTIKVHELSRNLPPENGQTTSSSALTNR